MSYKVTLLSEDDYIHDMLLLDVNHADEAIKIAKEYGKDYFTVLGCQYLNSLEAVQQFPSIDICLNSDGVEMDLVDGEWVEW